MYEIRALLVHIYFPGYFPFVIYNFCEKKYILFQVGMIEIVRKLLMQSADEGGGREVMRWVLVIFFHNLEMLKS
jgi:hypothetical protein